MGSETSSEYQKKQKQLSLITLNYSGILLSPFEFFSKDPNDQALNKIQQDLSQIFATLLSETYQTFNRDKKVNKFKWNLGKIDQKMQQQRYTPIYHKDVGLKNDKLMTLEEFQQKWEEVFDKQVKNVKGLQYKPQEKNDTKIFDLMCYKTILISVYGRQIKKNAQGKYDFSEINKLDVNIYLKFLQDMFKKSFLDETKKINKTFKAFDKQKIDVAFVQQANQNLLKELHKRSDKYQVISSDKSQSIIVCRRKSFNKFYTSKDYCPLQNFPTLKEKLNWNGDTTIAFVDNLILISAHLSSKKQKNGLQSYEMVEDLKKLSSLYPMCHIILGADGNSYLKEAYNDYYATIKENPTQKSKTKLGIPEQWRIYPDNSSLITTSKQRTYLQAQVNKANQKAQVSRDYLIFLKSQQVIIKQLKVCTILGKEIQKVPCLPCQEHPYDHYVVKAEVSINVVTNISSQKELKL